MDCAFHYSDFSGYLPLLAYETLCFQTQSRQYSYSYLEEFMFFPNCPRPCAPAKLSSFSKQTLRYAYKTQRTIPKPLSLKTAERGD